MTVGPVSGSIPSIPDRDLPPARSPAPGADWSVRGAVMFVLLVVGGAYITGFGLTYGVLGLRYGFGNVLDSDAPLWQSSGAVRFSALVLLVIGLLQLAFSLTFAARGGRDWRAALQLHWPRGLGARHWIGFLALLFLVKLVTTVVSSGLGGSAREDLEPFRELFHDGTTRALFLATVLLAGLTEEIIFRAVLSRTLEGTRLGFWGGAVLANLAFALLHTQYGLSGQVVVLAIGITLSWIRADTGSIWPGALCHAANNGIAFLAMRATG